MKVARKKVLTKNLDEILAKHRRSVGRFQRADDGRNYRKYKIGGIQSIKSRDYSLDRLLPVLEICCPRVTYHSNNDFLQFGRNDLHRGMGSRCNVGHFVFRIVCKRGCESTRHRPQEAVASGVFSVNNGKERSNHLHACNVTLTPLLPSERSEVTIQTFCYASEESNLFIEDQILHRFVVTTCPIA